MDIIAESARLGDSIFNLVFISSLVIIWIKPLAFTYSEKSQNIGSQAVELWHLGENGKRLWGL